MAILILENRMDALGVAYSTRSLLQDIDSNFAQTVVSGDSYHETTFTTASLSAGILSVNHALSTAYPKPLMKRPDGTYENAIDIMNYVDANNVTFDFGGAIAAGTWTLLIEKPI